MDLHLRLTLFNYRKGLFAELLSRGLFAELLSQACFCSVYLIDGDTVTRKHPSMQSARLTTAAMRMSWK